MPECAIGSFKVHVEVPLLLIFFAFMLSESVHTNLIIYRTCYVTLGYNKSECALLGSKHPDAQTARLEKIVEPYAAVVNMVSGLINAFASAVLCLFVGPWSDRFGRKPVLIIPIIGFTVSFMLSAVFASLETISPWYSLVTLVPVIVTGGVSSYLTVLLCYISDRTTHDNRGMRMGLFEGVLSLGIFLGNISSSYVFAATDYPAVFLISAFCCLLNLIFTVFFVPESLENRESEGRVKGLFQIDNIADMVRTTFRKRQNYQRLTVLCCVLMLTLFIIQINGDGAVIFLYLREKFNWSLEQYTLYSAYHNVTWIIGTIVGVYFLHKLLKIPETVMILVGFMSMLNGTLVMGLADRGWEVYAAAFLRSLGSVLSPMVRSLVSKIVPNEEVGKIFALIVVSESLIGMVGSPAYTAIYNTTISKNPAIFNFVSSGLYLVELIVALGIIFVRTVHNEGDNYDQLVNESENERQSVVEEQILSS